MKAPWRLALLAVVGVLLGAAVLGPPGRDAEAAPFDIAAFEGTCATIVGVPPEVTALEAGTSYCFEFTFDAVATSDIVSVEMTNVTGTFTHFACSFPNWCGTGPAIVGPFELSYTASSAPQFGFGTARVDVVVTDCTQPITASAVDGTTMNVNYDCIATGPAPTVSIIAVYPGACADLSLPLPPSVTTVVPGAEYCIGTLASNHVAGDTHTLASTGVGGEIFDLLSCFTNSGGFDPCLIPPDPNDMPPDPGVPHPAPSGSPYVIPILREDSNSFLGAETDFSFTSCTGANLVLTYTYDGPGLETASDTETVACNATGPAPTVNIIAVYPGTCADLSLPLPPSVTTVVPGLDYCIATVASDHVGGDTHTLASAGVGGEIFDLLSCFTNSGGFDPCLIPPDPNDMPPDPGVPHPAPSGSPYVIPILREDSNSFLGAETDFSFTSCTGANLVLTYTYDGPGLETASDTETIACQGEPPTVNIIAVYPGTCAALTLPLPPSVSSVSPGLDYCIATVASDHVAGDTHTLASAGVGGEIFDLLSCFTNSGGFDPCLIPPDPNDMPPDPGVPHPTPSGSPYVIPILREDSNSFLGAETDFSFTSCEGADLTLTYSYDGPGLPAASDTEVIPCVGVGEPPVGEFTKYTDASDEVVLAKEVFEWYIDVPDTQGYWEVSDYLPAGFKIVGFVEPNANCQEFWGQRFVCSGTGASSLTIVVTVKAPSKCGDFTNTAKHRTSPTGSWVTASDTVRVVGCEPERDNRPRSSRNSRNPRT